MMIIIAALFTASAVISLVMFKKVSAASLGTGHSGWGGVPARLLPDQWDPGHFWSSACLLSKDYDL